MKVKFGMIVTEGRGKLGGHVFSKNRSGAIVRTKVTPTNPKTAAQMEARNSLASYSTSWSGLTEEQRLAWNAAVEDFKKTNIFGDQYNPTGKNLYTKLNINLELLSEGPISVPPLPPELPAIGFTIGSLSPAVMTLQNDGTSSDFLCVISATANSSTGITNFSGRYRIVSRAKDVSTISPIDIFSDYVAKFGTPVSGQKISFSIILIDDNSGVATPSQIVTGIVI